jgi:elongation factor 1-gamma
MAPAFQTLLDAGFRKAAPKASAWFERVVKLHPIVATHGHIKACARALKPNIKAEVKVEKVVAKPKEEVKEAKKDVNPLDLLPETKFDLFNFKTFFVNCPDKYNTGVDEFVKQVDQEGWAFWFLHYDKYKGEGEVLWKTENLIKGFIQRFEDFRKYSFARMCVLGNEPNLEIEGVFLFRGTVIPQEAHDHPQFEYYKNRKLDLNNADDVKLIREFFGATEGGQCNGHFVQSVNWHK